MSDAAPCRLLTWDSEFFGRRIARVTASRLTPDVVDDVLGWSKRHGVECLYYLADADDPPTVRLAEDHGFRHVDVRVTLARGLDVVPAPPSAVTRPWVSTDLAALRALARISHRDSRFYADPAFPRTRCDDLYETWIERSCRGYADAVIVAEAGGVAVGYLSCHLDGVAAGRIGLFAVAAAHRGRGMGRALVTASLRWFAQCGVQHVTVVTQGRNVAAQRLYQRSGFVTDAVQHWYHKWLG